MISHFTLNFKDKDIEKVYRQKKITAPQYFFIPLFLFCLINALIVLIRFCSGTCMNCIQEFYFLISRIVLYTLLYIGGKKYKFIRARNGNIACIGFFILFLEENCFLHPDEIMGRLLGYQGFLLIALTEYTISPVECFVSALGYFAYMCIRLNFNQKSSNYYLAFRTSMVEMMIRSSVVFLLALYYILYKEKQMFFEYFQRQKNREARLTEFECIPEGVLLVQEKRVIHYNQELVRLLNLSEHQTSVLSPQLNDEVIRILEDMVPSKVFLTEITEPDEDVPSKSLWEVICEAEKGHRIEIKDEADCSANFLRLDTAMSSPPHNLHYFIEESQNRPAFEIKGRSIYYDNSDTFFVFFKDISAIKKLEKEKSENKYKNLLIKSITHGLRTPLNSITNMAELLTGYVQNEGTNYLKVIQNSCHLLSHYLTDALDYAEISMGNAIILQYSSFNPTEIVEELLEFFNLQAQQKEISLSMETDESIRSILSDENKFRQILINLINNAIKYTFKGKIHVSLSHYIQDQQFFVKVDVADSGTGIKEENVPLLFQIFGLIEEAHKNSGTGSGLSLSICKWLCHYMGGDIQVRSTWGQGSCFSFWIPDRTNSSIYSSAHQTIFQSVKDPLIGSGLDISPQSNFRVESRKASFKKARNTYLKKECKCPRILVVDDDGYNLLVMTHLLRNLGIECDTAQNGQICINMVVEAQKRNCCPGYSLVFMDIEMPIMNGYETSKILTKMMKDNQILPFTILAYTAQTENDHEEKCIESGIEETILKPIPIQALKDILQRFLIIR